MSSCSGPCPGENECGVSLALTFNVQELSILRILWGDYSVAFGQRICYLSVVEDWCLRLGTWDPLEGWVSMCNLMYLWVV